MWYKETVWAGEKSSKVPNTKGFGGGRKTPKLEYAVQTVISHLYDLFLRNFFGFLLFW